MQRKSIYIFKREDLHPKRQGAFHVQSCDIVVSSFQSNIDYSFSPQRKKGGSHQVNINSTPCPSNFYHSTLVTLFSHALMNLNIRRKVVQKFGIYNWSMCHIRRIKDLNL